MHPNAPTQITQPHLVVMSVGIGHGDTPHGDINLDLRAWFRNPHVDPGMRALNGRDWAVIASVLSAEGVTDYIRHQFKAARRLVRLGRGTVTVIVACSGGRHRSVVIADQLVFMACSAGLRAEVVHRDIDKPLLPSAA